MNCPSCGSDALYETRTGVSAGGGYSPNYLPGLGGFLRSATFSIVVCSQCGAMQFFADEEARSKLSESPTRWKRL
jgi:hypothetical protein